MRYRSTLPTGEKTIISELYVIAQNLHIIPTYLPQMILCLLSYSIVDIYTAACF